MKLLFLILLFSCSASKNIPVRQEQARLIEYNQSRDNKARLILVTVKGDTVVYDKSWRGMGKGRLNVGDKYTVHFSDSGIVSIKRN
jgi:hypothetical protein